MSIEILELSVEINVTITVSLPSKILSSITMTGNATLLVFAGRTTVVKIIS